MKKKLVYAVLAGIVCLAPVGVSAVAQQAAVVSEERTASLAQSLIVSAQKAEAAARAIQPAKTEEQVLADVTAAVGTEVTNAIANGATSAELQAAFTRAINTPNLSDTVRAALGAVQSQLDKLIESLTPGAIGGTANGAALPTPPAVAQPGAGYRG